MNRTEFIGNLTRDPEIRTTKSGKTVCSFTVAVNDGKNPTTGEAYVTYYRVNAWDRLGENCGRFLIKGRKVYVEGRVSANPYTDKDGQPAASLEVSARTVEFLSSIAEQGVAPAQAAPAAYDNQSGYEMVDTNDLPF